MPSLIPEACGRPGDDPIFTLNAEAQKRRAAGVSVVNASLGALLEDDGRLAILPTVFEVMREVDPRRAAAYAPIAGDVEYLDAVVRDALGESPLLDAAVAAATPGGTGAIHHAIVNFLEPGQALFTSGYHWSPYGIIARHTRRRVATFRTFRPDDGAFDVEAFSDGLDALVAEQGRALVVLNFPCHNPTGYSLDVDEWRAVADGIARAARRGPVAFLVDQAYACFGHGPRHAWTEAIAPVADRVNLLVAWTASKAFALYGARVGALVATALDADERREIGHAISYSCRGTWSNCNHLGLLAVGRILADAQLSERVDGERGHLVDLLGARVDAFNREAVAAGLSYPRYEGGFFVSVFTADARRTAEVCAEHDVFVVPMDGAVRVALCSTPVGDVPRLVRALSAGVEAARSSAPAKAEEPAR